MKLISKFNLSPLQIHVTVTLFDFSPSLMFSLVSAEFIWDSSREAILSPIHTLWISKWPFHNWNEIASGKIEFSNRLPPPHHPTPVSTNPESQIRFFEIWRTESLLHRARPDFTNPILSSLISSARIIQKTWIRKWLMNIYL